MVLRTFDKVNSWRLMTCDVYTRHVYLNRIANRAGAFCTPSVQCTVRLFAARPARASIEMSYMCCQQTTTKSAKRLNYIPAIFVRLLMLSTNCCKLSSSILPSKTQTLRGRTITILLDTRDESIVLQYGSMQNISWTTSPNGHSATRTWNTQANSVRHDISREAVDKFIQFIQGRKQVGKR